jgi:hypothetical protein
VLNGSASCRLDEVSIGAQHQQRCETPHARMEDLT